MDAHDNEAFAILHRYYDREHDKIRGGVENIAYDVANALRAAFAAGREAMRTDAVRVCEAKANRWGNSTDDAINNALEDAAATIRALPGKEGR